MRTKLIFVAAVLEGAACAAPAEQSGRIVFAKGASSASVEGVAIRGEQVAHYVAWRAGQELEVAVTSIEGNAVFAVFPPNSETPLAEEARQWKGRLDKVGEYKIVVGSTRGNATYKLSVALH